MQPNNTIAQVQLTLADDISIISVVGELGNLKWLSFKVPRAVGKEIEKAMEQYPMRAIIQTQGGLSIRKIAKINNKPTTEELSFPMRWAYQIVAGPQFLHCHKVEQSMLNRPQVKMEWSNQ